MAIGKKAGKVAKKGVSLRFKDSSQGGLPDDFKGTITAARFGPWNYGGKRDEYTLAFILTITPFPGQEYEEDIEQAYSVGSLEFFAPSQDGENAVDLDGDEADMFGPFIVPTGDKSKLSRSSNFMFMKGKLEAVLENEDIMNEEGADELIGLAFHWNRIPQPKRSGIVADENEGGEPQRERTTLVPTEVAEAPKAGKIAAKARPVEVEDEEAEEEVEDDSIEARVGAAVAKVLGKAKGNTLKKAQLPPLVAALFTAKSDKAEVVKLLNNKKFITGIDGVTYDADDATFSLD